MDTPPEQNPPIPKMKFTPGDYMFLGFMVLVLIAVVWVGILAHEEATKTEESKHNGELLVAWLTEAGTKRFEPDFAHGPCAGGPKAPEHAQSVALATAPEAPASAALAPLTVAAGAPAKEDAAKAPAMAGSEAAEAVAGAKDEAKGPNTWGGCIEHIFALKEFKEFKNPFFDEAPKFAAACVPTDASLTGAFVIEKMVATAPGSAVPYIASQFVDADTIEAKMQLRISICDKGSYAIKIAEFEF
jgi:hypothetical protein